MKITVESTDSAKSGSGVLSSFQNFSFQRFRFTKIPPFPPQPPFPRLRSGHQIFQRPSPQKQFPSNYADEFDEHYRWLNEESIVFVQIEHIEAVQNLKAILRVADVHVVQPIRAGLEQIRHAP
jgi:hypothetical protein